MNTRDDLPIGGPLMMCRDCGLRARSPIVIDDGGVMGVGSCRNKKACRTRQARHAKLQQQQQGQKQQQDKSQKKTQEKKT